MPLFSLDISITQSLNQWGITHSIVTKYASEFLVYVVIAMGVFWLATYTFTAVKPFLLGGYVKRAIHDSMFLLVIPVGVATGISEIISALFVRQRPFIALTSITALTAHSADGGMPSHHTVFMIAIATCVFFYHRGLSVAIAALTIFSGIARIASGFHYPTDVLAGLVVGISAVLATRTLLIKMRPLSRR